MLEESNDIGRHLVEFRKEKGLSQERLADKADLSTEFISRIERGVNSPSIKSLEKIAKVLEIDIRRFFGGPEDPETWNMEIESITVLLKNKEGKSFTKVFKLAEVKSNE